MTPDGAAPEARAYAAAQAAGYDLIGAALRGGDDRRPDIVVTDIRGLIHVRQNTADLVARARSAAPAAGLIILASAGVDAESRALLRRHGDVCFVGADCAPVMAAIRERMRLSSLADEMGERIKSLIADGRTLTFSGLREKPSRLSVLIAGKPSPLMLNTCNAISSAASNTICVFSAGQVMRALDHCKFDAAIILPTDETDLLIALARAFRRHRDHRKLSVILTSDNEELLDRCASRDGFDTILAEHLDADIAPRLETLTRRSRMAAVMREFLRSGEGCGGGKDGAASARFFAHHAVRAFRRADETRHSISLVALSLEPRSEAGGDVLVEPALKDALKTSARLVRAEDLIARLTPTTLVFLLRGADEPGAAQIAARLEGVIGGTLLRSALKVSRVATAFVERHPGGDIESSIAKLIRSLRDGKNAARASN